jgi:hypothetical protein
MTAPAAGVDAIYPPDALEEWQFRISRFVNGVMREEIQPALTAAERARLAAVTFETPQFAPGGEPFGFWRANDTVHLSAASMHLLGDLVLAYVWLGRNGYAPMETINDYMLMLSYWRDAAPPPPPRLALGVPDGARDDAGTDAFATALTHGAFLFLIAHELGHVLHGDPAAARLSPGASQAAEAAADAFALDIAGRVGRVPTGVTTFFQIAALFAPHAAGPDPAYTAAGRQTHPMTAERLRKAAEDIGVNARRYAKDEAPDTLAAFHLLASQLQTLADIQGDATQQGFLAMRGATIRPDHLAPRRPNETIGVPPSAPLTQGDFSGTFVGDVTVFGVPYEVRLLLRRTGNGVTGHYALAGGFGSLSGAADQDTLRFTWTSGPMHGWGALRRSDDGYEGSTEMQGGFPPAAWRLRPDAPPGR